MNNKEGKEGSWKRGKRGMKNKEGKEEPWKRGKAKPGKRTKGWPIKWKRKSPRKKSQKLASLAFEIFSEGFSFSTLLVISPSLFSGLTFPLFHGSSFPSVFFKPFIYDLQPLPSRPCPWHIMCMMLKSFYRLPCLHPQSDAQVGFLKMSAERMG